MENDQNCAGLAEALCGAGKGKRTVFYVTVGTGIGAGFIVERQIYRGRFGAAEIGHTRWCFPGGWDLFQRRSLAKMVQFPTLESLASGLAIERGASTVTQAARHVGVAVANAIALLNPEIVIVGGGVSRAGEPFFRPLRRIVDRLIFPPFRGNCRIVPPAFGQNVVVVGAALVAQGKGVSPVCQSKAGNSRAACLTHGGAKMRYMVFGDVHGNLVALDAVLAAAERLGVEGYLFVGDLIGYGPQPLECIDRLLGLQRDGALAWVIGNHEMVVRGELDSEGYNEEARRTLEWTRGLVASTRWAKQFIDSGNLTVQVDNRIWLTHDSLATPSNLHYHRNPQNAKSELACLLYNKGRVCFYGHTHVMRGEFLRDGAVVLAPMEAVEPDKPDPKPLRLSAPEFGLDRHRLDRVSNQREKAGRIPHSR